jgi:hypothetical protein
MLRLFALKTSFNISDSVYDGIMEAFPDIDIPTFKQARATVEGLSPFMPRKFDCCSKSCMAYTGNLHELSTCQHCRTPRYHADGSPRRQFTYLPLIPRLLAMFRNHDLASKLRYRHSYTSNDTTVEDIFDSEHYKRLCREGVKVDGKEYSHKYFQDLRELALGASTDGFAPFNRRNKTCWPIIIFIYNLPPELRFLAKYILCAGVVPGPNKPKDFDSFLWPLVQELTELAVGVRAFDAVEQRLFLLRAHLIRVFGDIPAMSMVMKFKGHNGKCPCQMCTITGLRVPGESSTAHYVPLDRSRHPEIRSTPLAVQKYNASHLPLRSHEQVISQAHDVDSANSMAQQERLAKLYGIKGTSILARLGSLDFPGSFPYDFMHLIYENVLKNLIALWTASSFKGLDEGAGSYQLMPQVWEAIGQTTAQSGSTIPSAFGASPPNVDSNRMACTADTWSFWLLFLGPILLRRRFRKPKYFNHFAEFSRLVHMCIKFELSRDEINEIRTGFQKWVVQYEK